MTRHAGKAFATDLVASSQAGDGISFKIVVLPPGAISRLLVVKSGAANIPSNNVVTITGAGTVVIARTNPKTTTAWLGPK